MPALRARHLLITSALAALGSAAITAPPAAAARSTTPATCQVTPQPSAPPADLTKVEVRLTAQLPGPIQPGDRFTVENPDLRLLFDPNLESPRTGQYTARLDRATLTASGTTEPSAGIGGLPLDLGAVDRATGKLLRWQTPLNALGSAGPLTATPTARNVKLGLTFGMTVTYSDPELPTFAPVVAELDCTTDSPVFSIPVYRPATAPPTVAKVLPNRAAPDSWVTIYGRRLDSVTSVQMLLFDVPFEIVSPTMLRAQVPNPSFFVNPGPFIPTRVTVTNDLGTSADTPYDDLAFLYDPRYTGPAVTSTLPAAVSTQRTSLVWLYGSGLKGASQVTIDGEPAPFLAVSDARIAVQTTPRPAGRYGIGVTTAAGTMPDTQISIRYEDAPTG